MKTQVFKCSPNKLGASKQTTEQDQKTFFIKLLGENSASIRISTNITLIPLPNPMNLQILDSDFQFDFKWNYEIESLTAPTNK